MSIATQQNILDALGLSAMTNQAQDSWNWAETAVLEYLGLVGIEQTTYVEYYPQDEGNMQTNDPTYVLDSAASRAVPGFYYSPRIIQLRNTPVRSITEVREDATGYFGQEPGSFGPNTVLISGSDYFLKLDSAGISWSGHLVRRAFWFPMTIGSVMVTYVAGLTAAELAGRYQCLADAVCISAADKYLRMKAVAGGQFPSIRSEGLGGGASTTYADCHTYGEAIPDDACDILVGYRSFAEERL